MPIYTGMEGKKPRGCALARKTFFCINAKASEADQKRAADFIYWLFSSQTGKKFVTEDLGFIAPFDTFSADEHPNDPLAGEVAD